MSARDLFLYSEGSSLGEKTIEKGIQWLKKKKKEEVCVCQCVLREYVWDLEACVCVRLYMCVCWTHLYLCIGKNLLYINKLIEKCLSVEAAGNVGANIIFFQAVESH